MDISTNARRLEIDEFDYRALLSLFIKQTLIDVRSAEMALLDNEQEAVGRVAHSIAGASAAIELWAIQSSAQEISRLVRSRQTTLIAAHLSSIRSAVLKIDREINVNVGRTNAESP